MLNFKSLIRGHQQHHAEPHKKARRKLVKQMGKRQARQMIRNQRSLAKVEAQILEFARQHAEKAQAVQEVSS